MAEMPLTLVLKHVRGFAGVASAAALSDGELLDRFLSQREETAFAILMQRHGPMVLRVCQRVLRNPTDAEDVFQATFLVLARRAASIRQQDSLAGWLWREASGLASSRRMWSASTPR